MKVTRLSVRKNAQYAPYEHRHIELTAELEEGEVPEEVAAALEKQVDKLLGIDFDENDVRAAEELLERAHRRGVF